MLTQFKLINITKKMCTFYQDVEDSINLRYVTEGNVKISRRKYVPESGQIELSLELEDPGWEPRLGRSGRKKWDEASRTFTEVSLV